MLNRTLPLWYGLLTAALAVLFGLFLQQLRSNFSFGVLSPSPLLSVMLLVIAAVLLIAGLRLRHKLSQSAAKIDALLAVRLLAAARAGHLLGALWAGFGAGLLLWLSPRLSQTAPSLWWPMLGLAVSGVVLWVAGVVAERCCKVPPADDNEVSDSLAPDAVS